MVPGPYKKIKEDTQTVFQRRGFFCVSILLSLIIQVSSSRVHQKDVDMIKYMSGIKFPLPLNLDKVAV